MRCASLQRKAAPQCCRNGPSSTSNGGASTAVAMGLGVTGGKDGGRVKRDRLLRMMRIGLPNGLLNSHQLRVIGDL